MGTWWSKEQVDDVVALKCFVAAARRGYAGQTALRIAFQQYSILRKRKPDFKHFGGIIRDSDRFLPRIVKSEAPNVQSASVAGPVSKSVLFDKDDNDARAEHLEMKAESDDSSSSGESGIYEGPGLRTRGSLQVPDREQFRQRRFRQLRKQHRLSVMAKRPIKKCKSEESSSDSDPEYKESDRERSGPKFLEISESEHSDESEQMTPVSENRRPDPRVPDTMSQRFEVVIYQNASGESL